MNGGLLLILLSLLLLTGCTPGTDSSGNANEPVEGLQRSVVRVGTGDEKRFDAASPAVLAVNADSRIFYILGKEPVKFCAEPPPETAVNVAQALASALAAGVEVSGTDTDVRIGFDQETAALLTQTVSQLFVPSQGLQFYRAGLLGLCQSFSNGSIVDIPQFEEMYRQLVSESARLISLEVEKQAATPEGQQDAIASLEELADALRRIKADAGAPEPEEEPETPEEGSEPQERGQEEGFAVTISVFGAGKVTFRDDVCTSLCTYYVSRPDEVVITGDKPADVEKWTGCDTSEAGECTVYIDSDKNIGVAFDN